MRNATMLYKADGPYEIHGGKYDYKIVDAEDVENAKAEGWFLTTPEAYAAFEASKNPVESNGAPTRVELEQKAGELKIKFTSKTSDKELNRASEAALKG